MNLSNPNLISVIIPTLNEAEWLPRCIERVRERAEALDRLEIVVADCASSDGTTDLARSLNLDVAEGAPASRSQALNLGARQSRGGILLFLHADSEVPERWDAVIRSVCERQRCAGGAFEFKLAGKGGRLRFVELVNRVRYRIWPWYFGDQGIFCSREAFEAVGGFPDVGILEDAGFCRRLRKIGRLKLQSPRMVTSSRRFLNGGVLRVLWQDTRIWFRYVLGGNVESAGAAYRVDNLSRG